MSVVNHRLPGVRVGARRITRRKVLRIVLLYAALLLFFVVATFPLYWMVMATLKHDLDLIDPAVSPFWFSRPLGFGHITYLFQSTRFLTWYENTYLVSLCVLVITLAVCIPGAYALARLRLPGGDKIGTAIFITYLIPPILLFLPLSQIVTNVLGLSNTKWALVVVYPTFTIPFCLWLLMGFFKRIPIEIEEAALVDGCTRWQAIVRVVLPLTIPGILTVAIFAFTLSMQDFIYALTFVSSSSEKVLNTAIPQELIRGDVYFWGSLMAAALLAGLPVAVLYNFFLDHFVEGITGGAIR